MAKQDFSQLIKKAQQTSIEVPKQKVVTIKESKLEKEKMFSVYIPEEMLKKLKIQAIEEGRSIKNLINNAIEIYLEKK